MAEAFKHLINADAIDAIGAIGAIGPHLARAGLGFERQGFERQAFEQQALAGLDTLELKARVMQVARARVATLPADVHRAADILEASLGPAGQGDDLAGLRTSDAGLAGWAVWPLSEAIALLAAEQHPARGPQALHAMTQRLTAEFAIRPFLVRHPALAFATLSRWADDPGAHVRRLVSKGWVITLAPAEQRQMRKRHSFKPVTTRRYPPGAHRIDLRINGQVRAVAGF